MTPLRPKWLSGGRGLFDEPSVEAQTAAAAVDAFAFDFYQHLHTDQPENLIFSPFSIWVALMMTQGGARANTAAQMAAVLHLPADDPQSLAAALVADVLGQTSGADSPEINIANRVWGQIGLPYEPAYLNLLANVYGSELAQTDFQGGSLEKTAAEVNGWVARQTRDKIPQIISPLMLNALTRLILVNAVYFKGLWSRPFSDYTTHDAPFYLLDGSTTRVKMMYQKEVFNFVIREDDYAAVNLPYRGGALAMLLILPPEGQFLQFERRFDPALFKEMCSRAGWSGEKVEIYLPRFELNTSLMLKADLIELGMPDAFDSNAADFSGMAVVPKEENLHIGAGVHRAYIKVDEAGTEAAAATAIIMQARSAMIEKRPPVIRFDRPFLYAIYDIETQAILFIGRVMNPAEQEKTV